MSAYAVHPSSRGISPGPRPLSAGKRSVARRFTLREPEQRRSGERRKVPSIASGRRSARGRTSRKSCPIALPPQQARAATADRILLGSSERDRVAEGASRSGSPQSRVPRTKSAGRLLANLPASDGRRRPLECQSYLAAVHFASGNPFLRVTVDSLKVFRPESRPDVHKTEGDARGGGFPVRQPAKPRSANKKAPGGSLRAFRRFPSFSFRPLSRPPAPPCPRH